MKINLVSKDNGVGLTRDAQIIREIAEGLGHEVGFSDFAAKEFDTAKHFDLNIFLELLHPKWFPRATLNWMIPNPEWYDVRWRRYAPRFQSILCKTRSAASTFGVLNRKSVFTSFTSLDRYEPANKDFSRWIHVAGRSLQKSTEVVFNCWSANPHFPHLTIVQHPDKFKTRATLPNLTYIYDRVPDNELKTLQNECGVHLCPSESEGFGHYINEAMSCKSVVLTTAGPPMNELIDHTRGLLCRYERKERQKLATAFFVTPETLKESVEIAMKLPDQSYVEMGEKAREFCLANDLFFRQSFVCLLEKCTAHSKHRYNPTFATRGHSEFKRR